MAVDGPQGPERKKFDNPVPATAVNSTTPYIGSMTAAIAEGTGISNRIGGRIHLKAFDMEMNLTMVNGSSTSVVGGNPVFADVCLVWDKQPDGALPAVSSIFVSTNTNLTFSNLNNLERFVILKRENVELDLSSAQGTIIKWHQPLELATRYGDATNNPVTNDLYVVVISPSPVAATGVNSLSIAYLGRITFTDE